MVQAFDHRAASIVVNPDNLNRPAQPRQATLHQHADPDWLPDPQFWIHPIHLSGRRALVGQLAFKGTAPPTPNHDRFGLIPRSGFGNTIRCSCRCGRT